MRERQVPTSMDMLVRDLPEDERPREKLLQHGAGNVSDVELLAILLRTGTENHSVIRVAEEVLSKYKDKGLTAIAHMSPREIASVPGIGPAKAAAVLAAVELGKRLSSRAMLMETVYGPEDAAAYAMPLLRDEEQEHFAIILLDMKNHIKYMPIISTGSLSASVVHPREVFRQAIEHSAASVILVHNHPSGDPSPSHEDINVTKRMVEVGKIMDIPVLDHIIIGHNRFCSLKDKGFMNG